MKKQFLIRYFIGIDIGGTKTRGILWDGKKIVKTIEMSTPKTKKELKNKIKDIIERLKPKKKNFSLGIGTAGIIKKNILVFFPNIPQIKNFDFNKELPFRTSLAVDNDARSFLRGETLFGAAKNAKSAFGITIGTGIGRAFAENGIVKKIKKFEYPEPWEKDYQKIRNTKNSQFFIRFLGIKLTKLLRRYNPEIVVIGGGATKGKNFFKKLADNLQKQGIKSKIRYSKLKKNAAALGAALIFKSIRKVNNQRKS